MIEFLMIKAICFDLDGVYFTPESFKRFRSALAINTSEEKAIEALNKSEQMSQFKQGKMSEDDFWNYTRQELSLTLTNEQIFEQLQNAYEINQQVKDVVHKARTAGYKTCLCSNNFVTRIRELENRFNFLADFDVHVFSYEVGVLKPDPVIFQYLVDKADVEPQEISYSDDTPEKLAGAKQLGINTFVFENFPQFMDELKHLGVSL